MPPDSPEPPPVSPAKESPYAESHSSMAPQAPTEPAPRFESVPSAFPETKAPMSKKKKVAIAAGGGAAVAGLALLLALL